MKDLTNSSIDRQNILNNNQVIENIQTHLGITGMYFDNEYKFTSKMVTEFYNISLSTLKRYVTNYEDEVKHNGYEVLKGQKLKDFKEQFGYFITKADDPEQTETDFPLLSETLDNQAKSRLKALAVFNFRSFLNLGMLLTESEKAKALRSAILDIVIDTLNQKMGGSTKYINQRDEDFLVSIAREPLYRKEFTQALNQYLAMGNYKYAVYTDAIYTAIFDGKAKEYKQTLQLSEAENPRDTMYAEIINLISSFEIGIADAMKNKSEQLGRKLMPVELDILIQDFASQRFWLPQITDARTKMASRDYAFRDIVHKRLEPYISSLSPNDYDRFLGDKSKSLIERVLENPALLDVFKRLKDR
ncbi:MAG: DNA-binding protein [Limnohabitans sp.]|nr:DNA-binding protein [Limnohabitans sp.]